LLNRLDVDVDDVVEKYEWERLLVDVIYSPAGAESLSFHYWRLLDKLVLPGTLGVDFGSRSVGVARSLEEAEDWEKLEAWMAVAWRSLLWPWSKEDAVQVTLKLLSRRPSALSRFEDIGETEVRWTAKKVELRRICDQVRTERSSSESLPP
jgi:hypothetical protein